MADEEQIILPERFKRVEYLESTGTQYINTEYVPTNTTGFWVDSIDNGNVNNYVMGMNETTDWNANKRIYLRTSTNLLYGWMSYNAAAQVNSHAQRTTASLNFLNSRKASYTFKGTTYDSSTLSDLSFTPSQPLYIGAVNFGGTITDTISKLTIFEVKISEGTEIVRHFIPAYDTEEQKPCLYEVKTNTAYYNNGEDEFRYFLREEETISIPERYVRVDYLESSGTQWIDTGIIPNNETGVCIKALQTITGNTFPIGAYNSSSGSAWVPMRLLMKGNGNYPTYRWGTGWSDYSSVYNDSVIYISNFNWLNDKKVNLYKGDTLIISKALSETIEISPSCNASLFAVNYSSGAKSYQWKGRVYEVKISQGNEIVRHFVPVFDTYTARYCMYELINGKVYYNNGTGDLVYDLEMENEQLGILHKLPEGFRKVKYLISNGYQYIDTNYVPTNETGYYLEGQGYVSESTARYYFGSNETTDWNLNQRIYFGATPNNLLGWMTSLTVTSDGTKLRQETNVALNFLNSRKCVTTINDADIINELSDLSFTPTQKIFLFSVNVGGVPISNQGLKGRIDTFLISEGDQIVRQFVPCLDEDGIPCMYELYTGTVHYNQGSGQFSYPREYTNDPINLPAGYTKCVYLQSDGTQWIDTEVIPNADTGVYIKAQHLSYGDHPPIGSWENSNNYYYAPRINTNSKHGVYSFGTTYQLVFMYDKGDDLIFTSTMNLYNDRTVNFWSDDTNWYGIIPVNFTATFTRPLWLFSYNMDNATINATYGKFGGRIFRAKITQGDYLIHDFVPCLDTDNRPCMYDLVTQQPYYNQSGGVEFSYCVEHQLPSDFIKLKYLESTGTQIIKTGIIPTDSTGIYVDAYHVKQEGNTNGSVIGLRNTNGNTYFYVGRVQRDTNGAGFGWGAFTTPGGNGNVRYEATLNFLNDRQSIITAPAFAQRINALETLAFTPTKDLYMFGMNNYDGAATLYSTYRIYRAKISEGSEIVRDWVPAMDNRNSKPCMYDLINNVAYYNDGTGDFDYNKDFEGTYKGFSGLGGIGNRLGYNESFRGNDESKYLFLSLNEYVDSLIMTSDFYACEIKFEVLDIRLNDNNSASYYCPIVGDGWSSASGETHSILGGLVVSLDKDICVLAYYENDEGSNHCWLDYPSIDYNSIYQFKGDVSNLVSNVEPEIIINGENVEISGIEEPKWWIGGGGGWVDNVCFGGESISLKIYNCKLYDKNGNEVSHMIPHEENGQKGLYCTIRNIFLPVQSNY